MTDVNSSSRSPSVSSVFNEAYIAELFESFQRDPNSVDESWRQLFKLAQSLGAGMAPRAATGTMVTGDPAYLRKVAGAAGLIDGIRHYGHLAAQLDPLGTKPPGAAELTPEFYGITAQDLTLVPAIALGFDFGTAADVADRLRQVYSSGVGYEFMHLEEEGERSWFRQVIEQEELPRYLTDEEKTALLMRLSEVEGLERFIARTYVNVKRFSIEGNDLLVPMLDFLVAESAKRGARQIVVGMAHRGRINVLAHVLDKPLARIFDEFEGRHADVGDSETGDVKYHLGFEIEKDVQGTRVSLQLLPNPSHLEIVDPVLLGVARARQRLVALGATRDEAAVVPVLVHGDAAFTGEGVVAETFNLSRLNGFRVGGAIHIIVNNQVGFTTDPADGRSTYYASDPAKGFEVPIVHVNADDPEACIHAMRLGVAYRAKFGKDFLIDVVGYRRHGHNEGDEPTFTQPEFYAAIKKHPTVRQLWGERLERDGVLTSADVTTMERQVAERLAASHADPDRSHEPDVEPTTGEWGAIIRSVDTAVRAEQLVGLNERLLSWPATFHVHPRLAKQLERRREALGEAGGIDWGHAEALAFASIVSDGVHVRLTGQDTERGTFSHRHAVLHDIENGSKYIPLQHLPNAVGSFEVYNSPLSEISVLGFEYGYSTADAKALVLWEAQFGDFINVAQPVIDQFIAADRAKWGQDSSVVLLLPHGYEGQGPEHSSARLERFLQLCAEGNMRVAYPTTPAQYFHILRRQAKLPNKRPLILMQPKSMLRLAQAASRLEELANGRFQPVLDDPAVQRREEVSRLVLCTGKIYYDLATAERPNHVAVVRVEELYPWPHEGVSAVIDSYPNVNEIVWAQEEPKNMGAWTYAAPRLRASVGNAQTIRYVGRPERSSPAEGFANSHQVEQARIVADAFAMPRGAVRA
ncbi:MAG TPA: 2-oxoglutarate dehydrogenase E1 component [Gemmatimonadaceae bacterium]|nr:2-oxoglutarate dehydrogenase E1 component [Gemmatimonadaceae bacterium]